jgi:hypothetical protein
MRMGLLQVTSTKSNIGLTSTAMVGATVLNLGSITEHFASGRYEHQSRTRKRNPARRHSALWRWHHIPDGRDQRLGIQGKHITNTKIATFLT